MKMASNLTDLNISEFIKSYFYEYLKVNGSQNYTELQNVWEEHCYLFENYEIPEDLKNEGIVLFLLKFDQFIFNDGRIELNESKSAVQEIRFPSTKLVCSFYKGSLFTKVVPNDKVPNRKKLQKMMGSFIWKFYEDHRSMIYQDQIKLLSDLLRKHIFVIKANVQSEEFVLDVPFSDESELLENINCTGIDENMEFKLESFLQQIDLLSSQIRFDLKNDYNTDCENQRNFYENAVNYSVFLQKQFENQLKSFQEICKNLVNFCSKINSAANWYSQFIKVQQFFQHLEVCYEEFCNQILNDNNLTQTKHLHLQLVKTIEDILSNSNNDDILTVRKYIFVPNDRLVLEKITKYQLTFNTIYTKSGNHKENEFANNLLETAIQNLDGSIERFNIFEIEIEPELVDYLRGLNSSELSLQLGILISKSQLKNTIRMIDDNPYRDGIIVPVIFKFLARNKIRPEQVLMIQTDFTMNSKRCNNLYIEFSGPETKKDVKIGRKTSCGSITCYHRFPPAGTSRQILPLPIYYNHNLGEIKRSVTSEKKLHRRISFFKETKYECCICKMNLRQDRLLLLKCSHTYHKQCLEKWRKIRNTCPTCRRQIVIDEFPELN